MSIRVSRKGILKILVSVGAVAVGAALFFLKISEFMRRLSYMILGDQFYLQIIILLKVSDMGGDRLYNALLIVTIIAGVALISLSLLPKRRKMSLLFCPKCRKTWRDTRAIFCMDCGEQLVVEPSVEPTAGPRAELESRFSFLSFGAFLIIVAVTLVYHAWLPAEILAYFRSFETFGRPVAPPPILFKPAIFIAYLLGAWMLISAAIRVAAHIRGVSHDVMDGLFFILCGYIFGLYVQEAISAWTLALVITILIGICLICHFIRYLLESAC